MSYIRSKNINGNLYQYIQSSHRDGKAVHTKHIAYLGKDGESTRKVNPSLSLPLVGGFSSKKSLSPERQEEIRLITKHKREIFKDKETKDIIHAMSRLKERGITTQKLHYDETNQRYSKKREELHNKIIAKITDIPSAVSDKPELILIGGPPGSGKSEVIKKLIPNYNTKYVVIDNDYIKSLLPEYHGKNANLLHDEASDVYNQAIEKANLENKNIILDATLKSTDKAILQINKFKRLGYKVKLYGTNIDREINTERAVQRFHKHGRYVPIEYIVENTPKINESVLALAKYADEYKIFDTSNKGRENARVILEGLGTTPPPQEVNQIG
jgi:predicted ABC-type ATPase